MAAARPRHDDTGVFAALTLELVHGGPGPQEHDLDLRDRDVAIYIQGANSNLHLLHLQNVRPDTIAAAQAAVDDFLGTLEPTDPRAAQDTVFENFDKVRQELRYHVSVARNGVEDLGDQLEWVEDSPKKDETAAEAQDEEAADQDTLNNPVAAVRAACAEFLEKLEAIDDSDEPDKREAHKMNAWTDKAHEKICEYAEAQAEKRGLIFDWYDGTYPRDTLRGSGSRILYVVYFNEDGSSSTRCGSA